MDKNTSEAAILGKSAASSPPINPITFDEVELAKVLSERFADKPVEKNPKPEAEVSAEGEEVVQDTEEKPDVESADADSEAPSQDETESETEAESEAEETDDTDSRGVQKRIDKLTAQKKEALEAVESLKERIQTLESKLEEVATERDESPARQAPPVDDAFGNVWDSAKIADERAKAKQVKRWCEDNPDGAVVGDKEYSAQDIRNIRRKAEDALDEGIPQREAFLRRFYEVTPMAHELYPFWRDRSSKEYNEARAILKEMPQLKSIPEHQLLIGDFIAGRNARLAKAKTAAKPAPKVIKAAPKQPSAPASVAARVDKNADALAKEKKRFFQTGGERELAEILKRQGYGV